MHVGNHFGWRYAFWVESILMLPFAILGFVMKPLQLKGFVPADSKKVQALETVPLGVQGYIAYNFVIGAYSYWGPKAGYSIYNMTNADMIFGGITIVCGILGTLAGGLVLDYMTNTLSNAFK
ncbi:putative sphingolipid transporter spinster 2-like, partial [Trifolium medium]|nr:putative sphingolipid transporter spinster 2-like [Trifolium medium]